MCGRYAASRGDEDLARAFVVDEVIGEELPPSWNVAPTDEVRVVLERIPRAGTAERAESAGHAEATERAEPADGAQLTEAPARHLRTARWGLVPSWAKDPRIGSRLINARSETVTEKPAFAAAAARRRCVLPADGYYEWQKLAGGGKQAHFLHGEGPLAFAGLYELWPDPARSGEDRWWWTTTILTTRATDALGHVHDRSPLLVPRELLADWLDPALTEPADVRSLIAAMPEPVLVPRPVGPAVGNVRNNGPQLVAPV